MSLIFNKSIIKITRMLDGGTMIIEIQRPTNKEKNDFIGATLEINADTPADRINKLDALRIQIFDQIAKRLYGLDKDGKTEVSIVDEKGTVLTPSDLPDTDKTLIVERALELNPYHVKN